jgi:methylenetetrahydrofolate reductase (NADPH)
LRNLRSKFVFHTTHTAIMKFRDLYRNTQKPVLSVELFPPKTAKGRAHLETELTRIMRHPVGFVSVTYGAGGSTQANTLELVQTIRETYDVTTVPHFTCVGASRQSVREYVDQALADGAENLVALRGDPPKGETQFKAAPDGFQYAYQLVAFLKETYGNELSIAVAGYPEGHVETRDLTLSVQHLKQKVDAGADLVITQLFYDNTDFFRFRDLAVKAGISVPIVPGILPITNYSQIDRITKLCGAKIPGDLTRTLVAFPDGSSDQQMAGIAAAIDQAGELLDNDVPGIHIFTLNNSFATAHMVTALEHYFQ